MPGIIALLALIGIVVAVGRSSFRIVGQAEVMVIERLGRFNRVARSGFNFLVPFIDRPRTIDVRVFDTDVNGVKRVRAGATSRIDLREQVLNFPSQPVITKDNVTIDIDAVIYYRVADPQKATYAVQNLPFALETLTRTTLRNIVGDNAMQTALQEYAGREDTRPDYFEHLVEKSSGHDLNWFFSSWVDEDRGLPDLSIGGIFPSPEAHQQILVAVDIVNDGYAEATVPLTVRANETAATAWVRVPAHGHITHRMLFPQSPSEVDLNDGSVPEVQDNTHRRIINAQDH